jgi:hypothetical protein
MSQPINDGGPAFPCVYYSEPIGSIGPQFTMKGGMTLRDYFAAAATEKDIQEFIPATCGEADQFRQKHGFLPSRQWARYCHADVMLKARGAK